MRGSPDSRLTATHLRRLDVFGDVLQDVTPADRVDQCGVQHDMHVANRLRFKAAQVGRSRRPIGRHDRPASGGRAIMPSAHRLAHTTNISGPPEPRTSPVESGAGSWPGHRGVPAARIVRARPLQRQGCEASLRDGLRPPPLTLEPLRPLWAGYRRQATACPTWLAPPARPGEMTVSVVWSRRATSSVNDSLTANGAIAGRGPWRPAGRSVVLD